MSPQPTSIAASPLHVRGRQHSHSVWRRAREVPLASTPGRHQVVPPRCTPVHLSPTYVPSTLPPILAGEIHPTASHGHSKLPVWRRARCCYQKLPEFGGARTVPQLRARPARYRIGTPFAHAASCMPTRTLEREHSMCRVVLDRWPRESMKTNLSRVCRYRYIRKCI